MADDPNRDLLPVREGSCVETCLATTIDTRNRHAVVKLDRYELEDRYLQMRDELFELKKLANTQEDKIKRLVTKLMRVSASPGSCLESALDLCDNKNSPANLEIENAKLKDKLTVLRSQLLNHKIGGRSPSRARRSHHFGTSGPTTSRSDTGRIRSSTSHLMREREKSDERVEKNDLGKIEDLETEKKGLTSRIEDLETQLANFEAENQRKKAAENVEFIRVWRQMKLQNEELVTCQARNATLEEQILDLKNLCDEKSRSIREITSSLMTEREKLAEMDEQLGRARNSQLTLREKNERIRDLMNEMKILHEHNAELIALSSKYSNAEVENIELRKKISEQLSDNLSLRSAFSNEQANITALQAANQQLIGKLHELQTNIDTLTIQLKTFQSQNEKAAKSSSNRRSMDRETSTEPLEKKYNSSSSENDASVDRDVCKNCRKSARFAPDNESNANFVTCAVQTEDERSLGVRRNSASRNIEKSSPKRFASKSTLCERSFLPDNGHLTPEEMIELLEKAQINVPLDAQNLSRIRRAEATKSRLATSDSRQSSCPVAASSKSRGCSDGDPWKILLVLYKILRENVANSSKILGNFDPCVCDDDDDDSKFLIDFRPKGFLENVENNAAKKRKLPRGRRSETSKVRRERVGNSENGRKATNYFVDRSTEMSECCCDESEECSYEMDRGYPCVPSMSIGELTRREERFDDCLCEIGRDSFKNFVSDFNSSIQKTFDNIHRSRVTRVDGGSSGLYKSWRKACESRNSIDRSSNEMDSEFAVRGRAATNVIRKEMNTTDLSLFVTWDLWNEEKSFTPSLRYPKFPVTSTSIYRVKNATKFFDRVLAKMVHLRIRVAHREAASRPVALAYLSIKDILDYPGNKFFYVADFSGLTTCSRVKNFARLSFWIRLNCNLEILENFKKQRGLARRPSSDDKSREFRSKIEKNRPSPEDFPREKADSKFGGGKMAEETKIQGESSSKPHTGNRQPEMISRTSEESAIEGSSPVLGSVSNGGGKVSESSLSTLERRFVNGKSLKKMSMADSILRGITPGRAATIERSDSSALRATEEDETTSEELKNDDKEEGISKKSSIRRDEKNGDCLESESINEFNSMIQDSTILSPRESKSSVQDIGTVLANVHWQKYRKQSEVQAKSLASSNELRESDGRSERFPSSLDDSSSNSCDALVLRIESLALYSKCSLHENPEVHQLYVEFSFLGYRGAELETISVPKPPPDATAYFNYMKRFELHERENYAQRKILQDIITSEEDPTIKFVLVSEPLMEEMETKECEEVGYAFFNIRDHILRERSKDATLTVTNVDQTRAIGSLKITLLGAEAIRRSMSKP